jgi:hypothetical protein
VIVQLPENATPLGIEYQPAQMGILQPKPPICIVHFLVPCTEKGEALCEICGVNVADYEGIICSECKAKIDAEDARIEREELKKGSTNPDGSGITKPPDHNTSDDNVPHA